MRELTELSRGIRTSHSVTVDNRERMTITGVSEVPGFNETEIRVSTDGGSMTVFGQNLHISKLNLDEGQLIVDGFIEGMEYSDPEERRGVFSKLFR